MTEGEREAPERTYTLKQLQSRIYEEMGDCENAQGLAKRYGVNSAHFYNVLNGRESPTLRRAMGAPKSKPRFRLTIEMNDREGIELFDSLCKYEGSTRHEMLVNLLWLYKMVFARGGDG